MVSAHSDAKYTIAASDYRCTDCGNEVACEADYYSAVIFDDGQFQRRNYCSGCWKRNAGGHSGEAGEAPTEETRPWSDVFASWRTRRPAAPSERPKKVRFDPRLALEFFLRLAEDGSEDSEDSGDGAAREDAEDASEEISVDAGGSAADRPDPEVAAESPAGERCDTEGPEGARPEAGSLPAGRVEPEDLRSSVSQRDQVRFFLALLLVRKKVLKFRSSLDRDGEEWLVLADRETPPRVHEVLNPGLTDDQIERVKDKLGELLQMQI